MQEKLTDFEEGVSRVSPSLDATLSGLVFWGGTKGPFGGFTLVPRAGRGAFLAAAAASEAG